MSVLFRKKSILEIQAQAANSSDSHSHHGLAKTLGVRDLTALGIAAVVGAGIFSTIGQASANGGPGVILLFIFTAMACAFTAFSYAEFASMVPVSGSAYTYSYVAFGELTAWIIGWALIMEYAIGNVTVAISWSDYFVSLMRSGGIHVPEWMTMDYFSAEKGFQKVSSLLAEGKSLADIDSVSIAAHQAWQIAPSIGGMRIIFDVPAIAITLLITWVVYRGVKESRNASNIMVITKLSIIAVVIVVGAFYVDTSNWSPFMPNGISGVLSGISMVFFAYIGFDAISTTAEECKDPQRDLPRGMMYSLIICTVLYVIIALILTGMVKYNFLGVGDPLAFVFEKLNMRWMSGIVAVSAVVAVASVLLVYQLGQPRIWMSMSRDGLLPPIFSKIHPVYKTPSFSTIVTAALVIVPTFFLNITMVTDLCSMGTLFAFVVVCGGVLKIQSSPNPPPSRFKTPYVNSKFIAPLLLLVALGLSLIYNKENTANFFMNRKVKSVEAISADLTIEDKVKIQEYAIKNDKIDQAFYSTKDVTIAYLESLNIDKYKRLLNDVEIADEKKYESGLNVFKGNIPYWFFMLVAAYIAFLCFTKNLSLIPVLGLMSCLYMMSEMGLNNWISFGIWLLIGLVIYFTYSIKNSKLAITK